MTGRGTGRYTAKDFSVRLPAMWWHTGTALINQYLHCTLSWRTRTIMSFSNISACLYLCAFLSGCKFEAYWLTLQEVQDYQSTPQVGFKTYLCWSSLIPSGSPHHTERLLSLQRKNGSSLGTCHVFQHFDLVWLIHPHEVSWTNAMTFSPSNCRKGRWYRISSYPSAVSNPPTTLQRPTF
mgnify:CR=1 FL=1